jgi:hypothetical protein
VTGRWPVFALPADKQTDLHRTSQTIVLFAIVDGEIKPIFIDAPIVRGERSCHGDGMAANIKAGIDNVVELTSEMWVQMLTGMAFDGQYIQVLVPQALTAITGGVSLAWRLAQWDGGHLLELVFAALRRNHSALNDKLPSIPWYNEMDAVLNSHMELHRFGKGHELFIDVAAEEQVC